MSDTPEDMRRIASCMSYNNPSPEPAAKHMLLSAAIQIDALKKEKDAALAEVARVSDECRKFIAGNAQATERMVKAERERDEARSMYGQCRVLLATHRCTECDARWIQYGDGCWSLASKTCGKCCDNVAMGDQIEPIGLTARAKKAEDELYKEFSKAIQLKDHLARACANWESVRKELVKTKRERDNITRLLLESQVFVFPYIMPGQPSPEERNALLKRIDDALKSAKEGEGKAV